MYAGVYTITASATGKRYVGSTGRSVLARINEHRRSLRLGRHRNPILQRAWNKYGSHGLVFAPLLYCDAANAIWYEQREIDATPRGLRYNINPNATSRLGAKHSDTAKAKMSAVRKGRVFTPEWRAALSAARRGKRRSPEAIAKMAAGHRGQKRSAEARARMSVAARARIRPASRTDRAPYRNRGRPLSPEHRTNALRARALKRAANLAALLEAW